MHTLSLCFSLSEDDDLLQGAYDKELKERRKKKRRTNQIRDESEEEMTFTVESKENAVKEKNFKLDEETLNILKELTESDIRGKHKIFLHLCLNFKITMPTSSMFVTDFPEKADRGLLRGLVKALDVHGKEERWARKNLPLYMGSAPAIEDFEGLHLVRPLLKRYFPEKFKSKSSGPNIQVSQAA